MQYVLEVYSLNTATGNFTRIDTINTWQNLSYSNKLNGIGGCRFDLALQDAKASSANLTRYKNAIAVKREGQVVWFGPITDFNGSFTDVKGTVTVDCNTWLYHLNTRFTAKLKYYASQDISAIAVDLINTISARTNGLLGITLGSTPVSISRDRTYEYKPVSEALIELSNLIGGFDFEFVPTVVNDKVGNVTFNTYPNKLGSLRRDLPVLTLGQNIKQITFKTDHPIENSSIAEGSGSGESIPTSTLDYGASQQAYTRREVILNLKDAALASTVGYYNAAYLNNYSVENYLIDIELYQNRNPSFTDLNLGDIIYITANPSGTGNGLFDVVNKQGRIMELNVVVDANSAQ